MILLDGEHLVEEALVSGISLETVAFADSVVDASADGLVDRIARAGADVVRVPAPVMAAMSPVRQPSGIVALAHVRPSSLDDALAARRNWSSCSTVSRMRAMWAPSSVRRTGAARPA